MSPVKAIKTFRDLLSFLTVIPVGGKEDFIFTTAEHMYLFPIIGAFIGILAGAYFLGASITLHFLLSLANSVIGLPTDLLTKLAVAAMTVAFLLVLTGLQHFDGLIDLGNAFGLRNLHERKMVAHAWTVTYWRSLLPLARPCLHWDNNAPTPARRVPHRSTSQCAWDLSGTSQTLLRGRQVPHLTSPCDPRHFALGRSFVTIESSFGKG